MALRKRYKFVLLFIALFALNFLGGGLQATPERVGLSQENIAVILLIDTSGSMRSTDPQRLRETAARVFIDLLSPEDYLGLITFDHEANVVLPLQKVSSSANKELFKEKLSPQLEPRGNTDFTRALKAAAEQFRKTDAGGARPVAVLLTDGEPDPDPRRRSEALFMETYMQSLWETVAAFALEGYPIYTVGFGNEIDPEVIRKVSLNTKGESYLLNEPAELLVSFFELLGNLKNRRSLIEKAYTLKAEETAEFDFWVDEYTRQINLVAVSPAAGQCALSLTPPQGESAGVTGLTVNNEENYSMAILHQPEKAYWGKWQGHVSGRGPVRVLGDRDLFIKAWLEEPLPSSQQPLHEPLHFKIRVTGEERRNTSLRVELQLKKPGQEQPVNVPLAREGVFFTGCYEQVDQTGTYDLQLCLLLDGEVAATSAAKLYVKLLPVLETDFREEGKYRQGEEVIVTASLNLGGKRLPAGRELKVKDFNLLLHGGNGSRTVVALYDDGDPQHGDLKAADGIWSNRFVFEQEGTAETVLQARGTYLDTEFFLEKNLGESAVFAPGRVLLHLPRQECWSLPGKNISIPLQLTSASPLRETIVLAEEIKIGRLFSSRIILEPGESKVVQLELGLHSSLARGMHNVPLIIGADSALTVLEPSQLEFNLEIVTPGQAFLKKFLNIFVWVSRFLIILGAAGFLFYSGGMLLYRFLVFPRKKVQGTLLYWQTESGSTGEEQPRKLQLGSLHKETIVISFDPENAKADFHIKGSAFAYDLLIKSIWNHRRSLFIQGWQALLEKHLPVRTMLQCTRPGIFEFEGRVYTCKELFHSDRFEAGEFSFEYSNPYGKWFKDKTDGANILEGKV